MSNKEVSARRERHVAVVLVACVALVVFWEVMGAITAGPLDVAGLTAADFAGFLPTGGGWLLEGQPVSPDPLEPNILIYRAAKQGESRSPALTIRLVHGYNMPDCMRIKGYGVEEVTEVSSQKSVVRSQVSEVGGEKEAVTSLRADTAGSRCQVWRVTSSVGDSSIWVTSMIRASDFTETDTDVRALPFPKVGIPDDQSWSPKGITMESLRHPLTSIRLSLRSQWNSSRCDLLTFLRLKKPAYVGSELLTLVTLCGVTGATDNEQEVTAHAVSGQRFMLGELQKWKRGLR